MPEPFQKVTALVTRRTGSGAELLLFQHPAAGVQLPAGSVEPGEEPKVAVVREVAEETGLSGVDLVGSVGVLDSVLGGGAGILHSDVRPSDRMQVIRRGIIVQLEDVAGDRALIRYEERSVGLPGYPLRFLIAGWVPADVLGRRVIRHLFHLRFEGDCADRWEVVAEPERLRLQPFWTPLEPKTTLLVSTQAPWLDAAHSALLDNEAARPSERGKS